MSVPSAVKRSITARRLIRADDRPPETTRAERVARVFLRETGRASLAVYLVPFAGGALEALFPSRATRALKAARQPALAGVTAIQGVHALGIARILTLYREEQRAKPPTPLVGALAGAVGYAVLLTDLIAATPVYQAQIGQDRSRRLQSLSDWYVFGMFAVDGLDGPLRREREWGPYLPMVAVLGATAGVRLTAAAVGRGR